MFLEFSRRPFKNQVAKIEVKKTYQINFFVLEIVLNLDPRQQVATDCACEQLVSFDQKKLGGKQLVRTVRSNIIRSNLLVRLLQ
jgi:hypothetical protein